MNQKPKRAASRIAQCFNAWNYFLSAFRIDFSVPCIQLDVLATQNALHLNDLSNATCVKGMLKGIYYSAVTTIFIFKAAFLNRAADCSNNSVPKTIYSRYSNTVNKLQSKSDFVERRVIELIKSDSIQQLEALSSDLYKNLQDIRNYTLKFHFIDSTADNDSRVGNVRPLYKLSFRSFEYIIKSFMRSRSWDGAACWMRL